MQQDDPAGAERVNDFLGGGAERVAQRRPGRGRGVHLEGCDG